MTEQNGMITTGGGNIVRPPQGAPRSATHSLKQFLEARVEHLAQWVRGRVDPAALVRFALLDYSQSEQLQQCSPETIYLALVACAQFGLEPGALRQEAFIVPYKTTATFMLGWRGMVTLARRSGQVKSLKANVVYENDIFDPDLGSDERVIHKPALKERGRIIGAYALAKMTNGELEVEWMSIDDLEKVRRNAKRGDKESLAYREWADQMYRKAPIRRLCKRLPLGEDLARATRVDELGEVGDERAVRRALDVESIETPPPAPELATPPGPVSAPAAAPPQTAAKGVAAAKEKLAAKRRPEPAAPPTEPQLPLESKTNRTEPEPMESIARVADAEGREVRFAGEPEDELTVEKRKLFKGMSNIFEHPNSLPNLKDRIERLPEGTDKASLLSMVKTAERHLASDTARAADTKPSEG